MSADDNAVRKAFDEAVRRAKDEAWTEDQVYEACEEAMDEAYGREWLK